MLYYIKNHQIKIDESQDKNNITTPQHNMLLYRYNEIHHITLAGIYLKSITSQYRIWKIFCTFHSLSLQLFCQYSFIGDRDSWLLLADSHH